MKTNPKIVDALGRKQENSLVKQTTRHKRSGQGAALLESHPAVPREVLNTESFQRLVALERRRTERSGKPFVLMLVEAQPAQSGRATGEILARSAAILLRMTRETDVVGWYQGETVVGVILTELQEPDAAISNLFPRANEALRRDLGPHDYDRVSFTFHIYPECWDEPGSTRLSNPKLYPDLKHREQRRRWEQAVKRSMDVALSLLVLTLGAPLFAVIALAIKLTSKGPVFYTQGRVGQHGKPFELLKFRSMVQDNDCSAHRRYVRDLIAGVAEMHPSHGAGVYKLTNDHRITRVGALLRKTSLDELPQFLNVLKGEMSLVGPRPPIAYELEGYKLWHRRRVLEAKPGITGLWQVNGRNRLAFDDMVRLDLRYAVCWSPWLDFKILLRTPKAMVEGAH